MRQFGMMLAVVAMQTLAVVRGGQGQVLGPGARVRVTTRARGGRVGELVHADSGGVSIVAEGSDQPTRIDRAEIERLEISRLKQVSAAPTWARILGLGVMAGGAWFGAEGWGHHARPKGVAGGVLGGLAGGVVAGFALHPWFERTKSVQQWEAVPVVALGVSVSF